MSDKTVTESTADAEFAKNIGKLIEGTKLLAEAGVDPGQGVHISQQMWLMARAACSGEDAGDTMAYARPPRMMGQSIGVAAAAGGGFARKKSVDKGEALKVMKSVLADFGISKEEMLALFEDKAAKAE